MADTLPDTLRLAVPTVEAVEAVAGVLVQLDHTDDYVRAFGATLDELEEWERNSARDAARDLLAALTGLTSTQTSVQTSVQTDTEAPPTVDAAAIWDECTDAHHRAAAAQGVPLAHPRNPYRTQQPETGAPEGTA